MRKYIYIACVLLFAYSCVKDDSSMIYPSQNDEFSQITISSPTDTLSVDFGSTFIFSPEIKQKIEGRELTYKWSANKMEGLNLDVPGDVFSIGEEATLNYIFEENGTYRIRLEVSNSSYSEIKTWTVMVRLYDEGIFVVGSNDAGECSFAFARTLTATDIVDGVELAFATNVLKTVNPEYEIKDVIRVHKRVAAYNSRVPTLVIFCKDKIFSADGDSFKIFREVDVPSALNGERLAGVNIEDGYQQTVPVFTDAGNSYYYSAVEFVFSKSTLLLDGYDEVYTNLVTAYWSNTNNNCVWVTKTPELKLWVQGGYYQGYKPQSNIHNIESPYEDNARPNTLVGRELLNICQMNGNGGYGQTYYGYAITASESNSKDISIIEFTVSGTLAISKNIDYISDSEITYKKGAPMQANGRYGWIAYSNEDKVYCWYPENPSPNDRLPTTHAFELGAGKEVTAINVSYDMRELYVAFYDHNSTNELKGGLYIYSAGDVGIINNLQPTKKFENITTKPIQIGYKAYSLGKYISY